jgi:hypothetical protein
MKRALILLLTSALAAAAGWIAGRPPEVNSGRTIGTRHRGSRTHLDRPAWAAQMANIRAVPGEGAEVAWLQWAFTIPDADVPAAIAMLNPRADFIALRALYARWVTIDAASAWASFRSSDIPGSVTHFEIRELSEARETGLPGMSLSYSPRSLIASRMLAAWASKDPAVAKAFAAKITGGTRADREGIPADGWAFLEIEKLAGKTAPNKDEAQCAEAAAKALSLPPGNSEAVRDATREWLDKNPAAACAWLRALPAAERLKVDVAGISYAFQGASGSDRVQILTAAASANFADSELEGTLRSMIEPGRSSLSLNHTPATLAATGMKEWMREDPAAARAWLAQQPDSSLTTVLTGIAAGQLARTDPAAALQMLNEAGGDQSYAVRAFVQGWTESDARAATAWAGKIEDAPLRDEALQTAASALSVMDPMLAAEAAGGISDAVVRQRVITRLTAGLSWNPSFQSALTARFLSPP